MKVFNRDNLGHSVGVLLPERDRKFLKETAKAKGLTSSQFFMSLFNRVRYCPVYEISRILHRRYRAGLDNQMGTKPVVFYMGYQGLWEYYEIADLLAIPKSVLARLLIEDAWLATAKQDSALRLAVESPRMEFATTLDQLRKSEGLTKAELARRLDTTANYVTRVLNGEVNMTIESVMKFARVMGHRVRLEITPDTVEPPGDRTTMESKRPEPNKIPTPARVSVEEADMEQQGPEVRNTRPEPTNPVNPSRKPMRASTTKGTEKNLKEKQ
ncbi:MAG: helix-turn-helix transcriptional regulator [Candidatus Accumulibacter sp.]|jgi:transcriptional regulator with XRE-family HTH domain|nr:helix-turn-helix transcriptional regulator [Accumulibacter sp.]